MSKREFLKKLKDELSKLPADDVSDAIRYYEEYIDDAGPENEEKAVRELGNPSKIATQIKADYAVKQLDATSKNGQDSGKSGFRAVFYVILGIFAAPVALPLAIAWGVVAIALFATLIAIVISIMISIIAVFGAGVLAFIAGISLLIVDFPGGILCLGLGFLCVGGTLLLGTGVVIGTRTIVRAIIKSVNEKRQKKSILK